MNKNILIFGASTRAAAQSARRAGLVPWTADLFADLDLSQIAITTKIEHYPHDFLELAKHRQKDCSFWLYTGGLENWPRLIDQISEHVELLGNAGSVLRRVRDPFLLAEYWRENSFLAPPVRQSSEGLPRDGSWLCKPRRSAGGSSIHPLINACELDRTSSYLQQRIKGQSIAANYVAGVEGCRLLGVTEQLTGVAWSGAREFQYAGSIGPLRLEPLRWDLLNCMGKAISRQFSLQGLFGMDMILRDNEVWPIEVNPRYTASLEILERALKIQAVTIHVEACLNGSVANVNPCQPGSSIHGKVILFSPGTYQVDENLATYLSDQPTVSPKYADIPAGQTLIRQGQPVCTIFAEGKDRQQVIQQLKCRVKEVRTQLLLCGSKK